MDLANLKRRQRLKERLRSWSRQRENEGGKAGSSVSERERPKLVAPRLSA